MELESYCAYPMECFDLGLSVSSRQGWVSVCVQVRQANHSGMGRGGQGGGNGGVQVRWAVVCCGLPVLPPGAP